MTTNRLNSKRLTIFVTNEEYAYVKSLASTTKETATGIFRDAVEQRRTGEAMKAIAQITGDNFEKLSEQMQALQSSMHELGARFNRELGTLSTDLNTAFAEELDDHREEVREILGVPKPGAVPRQQASRPTKAATTQQEPIRDESYFEELIRPD